MSGHIIEDVEVIHETQDAILVKSENLDEDTWIPQSQVQAESEVWKNGQKGDLVVSEWFARKKGWD